MAHRSILFVPSWVADVFKRNKLPLNDILDFSKVRQVLSAKDIAGLSVFQTIAAKEIFNVEHGSYNLYVAWLGTSHTEDDKKFRDNTLNVLENAPELNQELRDRFFTVDETQNSNVSAEAFINYDLSPEIGAIVLKAGFDLKNRSLKTQALEAVIQALYAYMPYNEVAKTPWFRQYLEVLSHKA